MKLSITKLSKDFSGKKAVKDVNLTLQPGVYGLLGANGAGKTTLMRMLAQLLTPTKGEILYNGKEIHKISKQYKKILGYLPQEFGYYPEFTAKEYMQYIGLLKGLKEKMIKDIGNELLEAVGLYEVKDKKMREFSGGMVRRVGIAQALMNRPQILILDEPTAGLDPQERIRFRTMIGEMSQNRIIILSTHIVSDIEMVAKNIIMMNKGEILKYGLVSECINEMNGKVWVYKATLDEFQEIKKEKFICSIKEMGQQIDVRIISETLPYQNAQPVQPVLEDLFAYYSRKESDIHASV